MAVCTYCDSELEPYEPVYLSDESGRVGQFCNYACLSAYVDEEELAVGDACQWSPGGDCC